MVCETLKPKRSGYSSKRRFRIVDFPAPEGPDITIAREDGVGAIMEGLVCVRMRDKLLIVGLKKGKGRTT